MKALLLLCSFFFMVRTGTAQYVSLPDSAFGGWLNQNGFSSCLTGNSLSGWQLDTTCTAVLTDTAITLNGINGVHNVDGVQYFKALRHFDCNNNGVITMPKLPLLLTSLICNNNLLTVLPILPSTLQRLVCYYNFIQTLPTLPSSLYYLDCSENAMGALATLPSRLSYLNCNQDSLFVLPTLPSTLTYLSCSQNMLTVLPALPASLSLISCGNNNLSGFPTLPASLTSLTCYINHIVSMPALPPSLTNLDCSKNNIQLLPPLPPSLTNLTCTFNLFDTLPPLPHTMVYLDCGHNSISELPTLPDSLVYLDCSFNPRLQCMPYLNTVVTLNFVSTAITCIPDTPAGNAFISPTVPICASPCVTDLNIGIHEVSGKTHLSAYPNPAVDHIIISCSEAMKLISIYNMTGKLILHMNENAVQNTELNISELETGIYLLQVVTDNGKATSKMVVTK